MREEPGADDAREEQVRRLLAAARHDEPVPEDVAARIDAALAAAAPERQPVPAPVVDLAARRRRRLSVGLAAAAVVVVAGVGLGASGLLGGAGDDSGAESGSESAQDAPSADTEESGPGRANPSEPGRGDDGDGGGLTAESLPDDQAGTARRVPVVREGPGLVDDLAAALRSPGPQASADAPRCAPPFLPGEVVRVRYDGAEADLVAGPAARGERQVEIYSCRGGAEDTPVRAATVPDE